MTKEELEKGMNELLNIIHKKDEEIEKLNKQNEKLTNKLIKISQILREEEE